ncbi:hypothetical protein HU200_028338 [Digitaria exilis]|uniref:PHD-type domain-containing protein n=1 Tax=Digitaria exilis TaxID=1010633 RepID=A0A835BV17_9POAL|nr:hypothetical protein HU200_028338 [Digitaria exilis]
MASDGAASRRPPLAPPPKRRSSGDLLQPDLLTYKRRRRATSANATGRSAVALSPDQVRIPIPTLAGSSFSSPLLLSLRPDSWIGLPKIYPLCPCFLPAQNQMGLVANPTNPQHQALARHWRSWRNTLEGLLQSPAVSQGSEGIQTCIRDALRHNSCQLHVSNSVLQGNLGESQGGARDVPSGAVLAKENNGALIKAVDATANNGALVKSENGTAASLEANKAKCNTALFEILVSEKFALLCDLLVATFHVNKPDDVIGLQKIDAKMRSGDYAQNPALLDQDIKKIWKKIGQFGQEMVGLASSLSVISPCDSGHSTIPKQSGTSGLDGICKDCGRKADSEGRIICDRCEAVFHVSCLKPAIDDVPAKWYCPTCNELDAAVKNNSNGKSHEDCNVCEWLEFKEPEEHPEAEDVGKTELAIKTQESSVASMDGDSEPDLSTTALSNLCKHCGTCEDEDKKFLVCGHPFCGYKFYHVLCLKESQIAREKQKNRACWYCPSCLCRSCFKPKHDEWTVLCDGCDDAYHTYCMNPPRNDIPKGLWYCSSCNARRSADGLQKYEKLILESLPSAKRSKTLAGGAPENK